MPWRGVLLPIIWSRSFYPDSTWTWNQILDDVYFHLINGPGAWPKYCVESLPSIYNATTAEFSSGEFGVDLCGIDGHDCRQCAALTDMKDVITCRQCANHNPEVELQLLEGGFPPPHFLTIFSRRR